MNIRTVKHKITSHKTDKLNAQHLKSDPQISFAYVQCNVCNHVSDWDADDLFVEHKLNSPVVWSSRCHAFVSPPQPLPGTPKCMRVGTRVGESIWVMTIAALASMESLEDVRLHRFVFRLVGWVEDFQPECCGFSFNIQTRWSGD